MYLNGYGMEKIKYELEKQGRKTALGKDKWFDSVISKTLQNSFYCGIIKFHKEYTPDYLTQKRYEIGVKLSFIYQRQTRTYSDRRRILSSSEYDRRTKKRV